MFKVILIILSSIYCLLLVIEMLFMKTPNCFNYYFGVPGSGKTTIAAWITKKRLKKKKNVHSNVDIKGAYAIDKSDIGHYDISNTHLLLDEASVDFNNRNFKSNFDDDQIEYFKKHRHYNTDISIFSQSWEDSDVTLRRLATRYYYLSKSFIPLFISKRLIKKSIRIDKETGQIIDGYKFAFLGRRLVFAPAMWKMFNTHERKELPKKVFKKY